MSEGVGADPWQIPDKNVAKTLILPGSAWSALTLSY